MMNRNKSRSDFGYRVDYSKEIRMNTAELEALERVMALGAYSPNYLDLSEMVAHGLLGQDKIDLLGLTARDVACLRAFCFDSYSMFNEQDLLEIDLAKHEGVNPYALGKRVDERIMAVFCDKVPDNEAEAKKLRVTLKRRIATHTRKLASI